MTVQWEKVHVFISSTFNDMHAERDYLVKSVFPELREWCERRKLRLVDIDLRWGVTEQDATQNKNVVKVCLDRIDDCRPFFLCFLGQRRGWVPKVSDISVKTFQEFPGLKAHAGQDSVTEMEIRHALFEPLHKGVRTEKKPEDRFYQKSDHAFFYLRDESYLDQLPIDPPQLREIYTNEGIRDRAERKHADQQLEHWRQVEIQQNSQRPVRNYQVAWNPRAWTPELLIPLQCPSGEEQAIKRWRLRWQQVGIEVPGLEIKDDEIQGKKAVEYNRSLTRGRLGDFHLEEKPLAQVIIDDLKKAILERYPDHDAIAEPSDLQKEIDQQEQFLFISSEGFISRGGDFEEFDQYIHGDSRKVFVLTAPAGMGKSTLLANWIDQLRKSDQGSEDQSIHFRFIGQSDHSTDVYSLLHYLLRELKEIHDKFDEEIPSEPQELRKEFSMLLAAAGKKQKTVIVLDALNQLQGGLMDLTWLPWDLPRNVKLIISFKSGEERADVLLNQLQESKRAILTEVQPFDDLDDRRSLVNSYLEQYLKDLDDRHLETLINSPGANNPLYLKVVLSELRVFGVFEDLGRKIKQDFGDTPKSAFKAVLNRLEIDPAYTELTPSEAVPLLFGLLAHARRGLSVEELAAIFERELEHVDRQSAIDTIHHYLRQVRPFLAHRDNRNDFFYESFLLAARERYVASEGRDESPRRHAKAWHRLLAGYFDGLPLHFEQGDEKMGAPNIRKVSELPYHQAWGELRQELRRTMSDYEFLYAKISCLGPQTLVDDFDEAIDSGYKDQSLNLIQGAIRLSLNTLSQYPEQLSSQLTGRLISSQDDLIHELLDQIRQKDHIWIRPLTKGLMQAGEALLRIIPGTNEVQKVAVSLNGDWIVTCNVDGFIESWEMRTGKSLHSIDHESISEDDSIAISEDGLYFLVYLADQDTIEIWDPVEETKLMPIKAQIEGYTYSIDPEMGQIAPDWPQHEAGSKRNIVWASASDAANDANKIEFGELNDSFPVETVDGKLIILPLNDSSIGILQQEIGTEIPDLPSTGRMVSALAISPDGFSGATESENTSAVKIWQMDTGDQLFDLEGHAGNIEGLTFTPDGIKLVAVGNNLTTWDIAQQGCAYSIKRHGALIDSVVVSPDSRKIFTASRATQVYSWDLETGQEMDPVWEAGGMVHAITTSNDGRYVYIVPIKDTTIRVWDLSDETELYSFEDLTSAEVLKVSGDGKRLGCAGETGIQVWDLEHGRNLFEHSGRFYRIGDIDLTPDGSRMVSVSHNVSDMIVRVWDIDKRIELANYSVDAPLSKCAISSDGRKIIAGEHSGVIHILHIEGLPATAPPIILADEMQKQVETLIEKGVQCIRNGEHEQSLDYFYQAIELDPKNLRIRLQAIYILFNLHRYHDLLKLTQTSMDISQEKNEIFIEIMHMNGIAYYAMGELADAIPAFDQVLKVNPDHSETWLYQGLSYFELGNFQAAQQCYRQARKKDSAANLTWMIGECHFMLEEYDQVIQELTEIIDFGAEEPKLYYLLGFAHHFTGDQAEAQKYLNIFIQAARPEHANLVFNAKEVLRI
ncbi:MAG: DUF4062 domain-containing protein [Chloroflexota bacterium]|nr:MAG: DUF4062 domain-containing protein [Chloroflexota bacterium]